MAQKLSAKAKLAKKKRDLAAARAKTMTTLRRSLCP